jgi:hypothetical protein
MNQPRGIRRRTVIAAATTGGLAAGIAASTRWAPRAEAEGEAHRPRLRPISMAMHIHGPFSEGIASFEAHLEQARRTGVDVIWWTDHDFRVAAHDHRRAVHFDAVSEPEGTLAWDWAPRTEGSLAASEAQFVDSPHSPDDPARALRLSATGGDAAGGIFWYAGTAWNFTYSTCIADTTLEIDVLPELVGPGASFLLQMDLSFHPERAGRPAGNYQLRYRVGGVTGPAHVAQGLLGVVDIPAEPGAWRRLTLDLVADVRALWPDLVAEDNSLRNLRVGVSAPAATPVSAVVDRLLFHRARRQGQAGEELRREVLARYDAEYADIAHYRGYEISLTRHLNWYGGDQALPVFPSPPIRDNDPVLTRSMVDWLHSHGGLVCWNHPMDVETRESLAALMIEQDNLGTDLVEIGREPLADQLWVMDVAARNAVVFTAVGSSDDHGGRDWLTQEDRWITYVWAGSTGKRDLIEALRRGRAWFTDLAVYRGSLDLRVRGRSAMGSVLCTPARVVPVEVVATNLPADGTVEVVVGVVDRAGTADLAPATRVTVLQPVLFETGSYTLPVATGSGVYVRTQVRRVDGTLIGASNPLWLLRDRPGWPVPPARLET